MSDYNFNLHIIDSAENKTRHPENKVANTTIGDKKPMSKQQAQEQLAGTPSKLKKKLQGKIGYDPAASSMMKGLGVGVAAVATATQTANFIADYTGTSYAIRGADSQARMLDHTMDKVNAGAGLAGSALGGAAVGQVLIPIPGVGAAIGAAVGSIGYLGKKAWNLASDNREYIKEIQVSKIEADYYKERQKQNITHER